MDDHEETVLGHSEEAFEARLAGIVESAMDAIITVDSEQRIVLFNRAAEKMFLCPAAEAIGQTLERFIPAPFRAAHRSHIESFGRTGVATRAMGATRAVAGLRSDGEEFPVEASISQVEADGQKLYTVILRDITKRKNAEDRIREQAALLDQARDAILVRDLEDRILYWNRSAEIMFGWPAEEAVGKNARDLLHGKDPAQFDQAKRKLMESGQWGGELSLVCKGGLDITVDGRWTLLTDERGEPKSVLVIDTDITEKKRLEAQFLRAQRMESIGTLAGGIAHDLNNIFSPVMMALEVLQSKHTDEESQMWLRILGESVERGASMVRQVLSFARGADGKRVTLHPKHLLTDLIRVLKETLPKMIDLRHDIPSNLLPVSADATQLQQVLMNLCVNARDAMPGGGRLTLAAENKTIDEAYARMSTQARVGDFVRVTVADTGVGMPPEVLERIFEPFFTTKEEGKGTGIGLPTALAIVKAHGGFIDVQSEAGRGTRFHVYLPALSEGAREREEEPAHELPAGCGELIMVVDDEESIRLITKATLEAFGYKTILASDGTEAVALYAGRRDEVKAVVTDMLMPYMDGAATIRALARMNPLVKVIAVSGSAEDAPAGAHYDCVRKFITKPYTAEALLRALMQVLGNGSSDS